jgi:hypothetical protein
MLRVDDGLIQYAVGCIEHPTHYPGEDVHGLGHPQAKLARTIIKIMKETAAG